MVAARGDAKGGGTCLEQLYAAVDAKPKVPVLELRRTSKGRGMVALEDIEAGQVMVRVPMRHVIHVIEDEGTGADGDVRLAKKLFWTLSAEAESENETSSQRWELYARMLPTRTGCAALWDEETIEEMQFLPAVESALRLKDRFQLEADRAVQEHAIPCHAMMWALSIVHSRSFAVCNERGKRIRALVPVADLFNHKSDEPAAAGALDMQLGEGETGEAWQLVMDAHSKPWFQMSALEACIPGEEIFINYGHETSAELLTSYGFIPDPNPSEYVPLYQNMHELLEDDQFLETPSFPTMQRMREMLISSRSVDAPLAIRPGGVRSAGHLLGCLRVLYAQDHELGFLHEKFNVSLGELVFEWEESLDGCPKESRRKEIERLAIRQCSIRAIELLAEFPTTHEEDVEILDGLKLDLGKEQPEEGFGQVTREWLHSEFLDDIESRKVVDFVMALRYRLQLKSIIEQFLEEVLKMGFDEEELCMGETF
uniref:SET domain-containing protein n=1 Tax=Picocystis salinarum TaxID=88271 RepID=A0A7S3UAE9_9CHLO